MTLFALVFLSRWPFIFHGYGSDADAWRVVLAGKSILATGKYSVSRFPGYPIHEFGCALMANAGPLIVNGVTAALSAVGAVFFALSMRELGYKHHIVGALALAFVPVVYINSTSNMDYVWALALILGSLHSVLVGRAISAGILLGLAIGCRITSGAMALPLALLLIDQQKKVRSMQQVIKLCVPAFIIATLAFVPAYLVYGLAFLTFHQLHYPPMTHVIQAFTVGTWGEIGLGAIVLGTLAQTVWRRAQRARTAQDDGSSRAAVAAWLAAVLLYGLAFLRLPTTPGYLIPMVPFVILLLNRAFESRVFVAFCACLVISPFVGLDWPGLSKGQLLLDHDKRRQDMEVLDTLLAMERWTEEQVLIVAGAWAPKLRASGAAVPKKSVNGAFLLNDYGRVRAVFALGQDKLEDYLARGYRVYYLPGVRAQILAEYRYDLMESGAVPLLQE